MKLLELIKLVNQGKQPVVEFAKEAEDDWEEHEKGMRAKLISVSKSEYYDEDGTYKFLFDVNPFKEYNHSIDRHDFIDKEGNPTLAWDETNYYPKDGKYIQFLKPGNNDDYLKMINNPVFDYYLKLVNDGLNQSYIEWLETSITGFLKL